MLTLLSAPSCWSRIQMLISGSRCSRLWESECPEGPAHSSTISPLPVYSALCVQQRSAGFRGRRSHWCHSEGSEWIRFSSLGPPGFPLKSCKTGTMTWTKPHMWVYCNRAIMFLHVAQRNHFKECCSLLLWKNTWLPWGRDIYSSSVVLWLIWTIHEKKSYDNRLITCLLMSSSKNSRPQCSVIHAHFNNLIENICWAQHTPLYHISWGKHWKNTFETMSYISANILKAVQWPVTVHNILQQIL